MYIFAAMLNRDAFNAEMFKYDGDSYLEFLASLDMESAKALNYSEEDLEQIKSNLNQIEEQINFVQLDAKLYNHLSEIEKDVKWYLILEPLCKESTLLFPWIYAMAYTNESFDLKLCIQAEEIESVKSIQGANYPSFPQLIFDAEGVEALDEWGPRPQSARRALEELKVSKDWKTYTDWYKKEGFNDLQTEFVNLSKSWL